MPKIHCDDCAYQSDSDNGSYCESPNNWTLVSNWRRQYREYKEKPETRNANNNCPDFKLVWYQRIFKWGKK